MSKSKFFRESGKLIAAVLVFGTFAFISNTFAWTVAPANPPSGNVSAPINEGGTAQSKIAGLLLNTGNSANGLIVQFGKVGIGTTSPQQALDVDGNIRATRTYVDQVCNRAGLNCLDFSAIASAISGGSGGGSSGGLTINSFTLSPSPVIWGHSLTWSGTATGGTGANCITRHRAYVSGSTGGLWTNVSDCPATLTLNRSVNVTTNASSFWGYYYSTVTYTLIWEVQTATQGVTAVRQLTVNPQAGPSVSSFTASPTTVVDGTGNVTFTGSASQGTACIVYHRIVNQSNGYSPGVTWMPGNCASSATLSASYPASISLNNLFNSEGANTITWEVKDQDNNITRQDVVVNVWHSGSPNIDSFTIVPSNLNWGQNMIWSGSATRGSYCITGHRAFVVRPDSPDEEGNVGPGSPAGEGIWTDVPCVSTVTLDTDVYAQSNESSFFYYSSWSNTRTYKIRWEVRDSNGSITSQDVTVTIH